MFFSKSVIAIAAVLFSVSMEVSAHAAIAPVLGVNGKPARNDVQRPTNEKPCGNTNIAQKLDSSSVITLKADKSFDATITNFNTGVDGSREIVSALVDVTGTGKKFTKATVKKNGTKNPTNVGPEELIIQLPSACQGGKSKNKCLVSLKTAGGFGNCVVVQNSPKKREDGAVGTRAARAARIALEDLD
ncbi:hypothetical protein BD311DRAFT_802636 [Dichomitus squalens]|uniref:Uncharacterized protein n=1 Tax=Dichomitus squalens TaxID=114155 RepID=A0A4V6MW38_9APHY|nr:hypothetical protein BD311DRAFT_802636 [Dichomitus squalens]